VKTRHWVRTGAVGSVALLTLTGCVKSSTPSAPQGSGGAAKSITVFISGGDNVRQLWQDSLVPAFNKANPGYSVAVNLDLHGEHDSQTMAKLTSATQQNKDPGFDLVDAGFITQAASAGLLIPVSTSSLPALKDVPPKTVEAGGSGGIPYRGSSVLIAYDTKTVTTPPKTLDDVLAWIKANPGKLALRN
jgi:putative spermidine/putrescine transport system substrate-binding protein